MKTLIALLLLVTPLWSQSNGCDPKDLVNPNPTANGKYGVSDIHKNRAVVTSFINQEVYVFDRTGQNWNLKATIPAGINGGRGIAVHGDTIAIGRLGSVGIYVTADGGTTWTFQQNLNEFGLGIGSNTAFGTFRTVDLHDDRLVIGAPAGDVGAVINSGAAFVYERSGTLWTQVASLHLKGGVAAHLRSNKAFGASVAVNDDYVVIGNAQDAVPSFGSSIFIFSVIPNYDFARVFIEDAGDFEMNFGWDVDISGDRVVAGARESDQAGISAGKAKVYINVNPPTVAGWQLDGTLIPSDIVAGDEVGHSVAIKGNTIYIGSRLHDSEGIDAGAVWVFKREAGVWVEKIRLGPGMIGTGDLFGSFLSLGGGRYGVVGSTDEGLILEGAARIFNIQNCPIETQ